MALVEQRNWRYAYLLWEFWKNDSELFPKEIIIGEDLQHKPHALIFVFDGSLDEIPNGEEETKFYWNIINSARAKSDLLYAINKIVHKLQLVFFKANFIQISKKF